MKTSARFLAVLLAVLMVASSAISVFAAPFSDVEEGYDHTMAITTLTQLGVIGGYGDGTYKPNNPVERDEMAKLVYVLYTTFQDAGAGTVKFDDVKAGNWAAGFISWCSAKSIVGGYGDGTFRPDNVVTYDEALKMVCCVLGYTDFDSSLWPVDVRTKALKELKLGTGLEDLKGTDKMTRGQVAQLLYNALTVPMNETKIEYVYQGGFSTDPEGKEDYRVKVPVEVAMTLAEDVWGYVEETLVVVGTAGYTIQNGEFGTATSIKAQGGSKATYTLAELGLSAYANKTDDLFLKQIVTVSKNGQLLANATVLGNEFNVTLAQVKTSAGAVDNTKVSINGVTYPVGANGVTFITATGDDLMRITDAAAADVIAKLTQPHAARAIDVDGDAVVDFVAIGLHNLFKVTKVEDKAAAGAVPAHKLYTFQVIVNNALGATFTVRSIDLAEAATYAVGDVVVGTRIGHKYYVAEKLVAKEASASKITDTAITLSDIGEVAVDANVFGTNTTTIAYNPVTLFAVDANGKQFTQNYYLYNGKVVYTTAVAGATTTTPAAAYKFAVLLYVEDAGKPTVSGTTMTQEYTAVAIIDGAIQTVKLAAIVDSTGTISAANAAKDGSGYKISTEDDNSTVKYLYKLVTYTVNSKGEYTFSSVKDDDVKDQIFLAAGETLKVNPNTGIYTISGAPAGTRVVLDANSVIYYTYTKSNSKFVELGSYNSSNILSVFKDATTAQRAYLTKNADGTYTLLATVLTGALVAPDATEPSAPAVDYKTDARLIKYAFAASGAEFINGKAYRTYSFMDLVALTDVTAADTGKEMSQTDAAVKGGFYAYVDGEWTAISGDIASVQTAQITIADAARGLIYISGLSGEALDDYAEGMKFDTSIKVWAAKAGDVKGANTTVYDLAGLAKIIKDTNAPINCKVGTYGTGASAKIAWIIIDDAKNTTFYNSIPN